MCEQNSTYAALNRPKACHGNWSIIIELQAVQRKFTRLINDIGNLPYSERLRELRLTTLAERRLDPLQNDFVHLFIQLSHIVTWICR